MPFTIYANRATINYYVDQNDTITSVNSAAIGILGVGSDCVGRSLAQVSGVGTPLATLASEVAERNEAVWDRDFTMDHGGCMRRIRAHAHVLRAAGGGSLGCLFLLRDVSDRVLIEERIRRMERFISLGTPSSQPSHSAITTESVRPRFWVSAPALSATN
jgi:two-component system, NtrC family, sensor histidine kinase HydH